MQRFCYTAILGAYDDLPTIRKAHPDVRHVCFTDTPEAFAGQKLWTIVEVAPYFKDRKLATGYLKCLSHVLFGDDVVSLWVDGNLRDIDLALAFEVRAPLAVPSHSQRNSVAKEAEAVVGGGLEDAAAVARHLAFLRDTGFADDVGLSEASFLLRDHRDPRVRRANAIWWDVISGGTRRDQLSFDYACWAAGIRPTHLDADCRVPNGLFSSRPHKNPSGRQLLDIAPEWPGVGPTLDLPAMPPNYPAPVIYLREETTSREGDVLRALNATVAEHTANGVIEGNYGHFDQARVGAFTPADPRRSWKREYLRRAVRGARKALEIGFNAGHSAAIALSAQPDLVLHSIDIAEHPYVRPCAARMRALFGQRFGFTVGDSNTLLLAMDLGEYDFIHLDGGHDFGTVSSDLALICLRAAPGTLVLVDDAYVPYIDALLAQAIQARYFEAASPNFPCSGENRLFRKRGHGHGVDRGLGAEAGSARASIEVRAELAEARAEITAMRASTSWRVSRPVRAIGRILGRGRSG